MVYYYCGDRMGQFCIVSRQRENATVYVTGKATQKVKKVDIFVGMDDGTILTVLFDTSRQNLQMSTPSFCSEVGLPEPLNDEELKALHSKPQSPPATPGVKSATFADHSPPGVGDSDEVATPGGPAPAFGWQADERQPSNVSFSFGGISRETSVHLDGAAMERKLSKINLSQLLNTPRKDEKDPSPVPASTSDDILKIPVESPLLADIDLQLPELTPRGKNSISVDNSGPPSSRSSSKLGKPAPLTTLGIPHTTRSPSTTMAVNKLLTGGSTAALILTQQTGAVPPSPGAAALGERQVSMSSPTSTSGFSTPTGGTPRQRSPSLRKVASKKGMHRAASTLQKLRIQPAPAPMGKATPPTWEEEAAVLEEIAQSATAFRERHNLSRLGFFLQRQHQLFWP
eukprot:TRINITY_DN52223_c0_g1_i1.p1 TRINITY_DN52223_c0_g1~~TRINITY_DN52223_c0_g1_i1.p1  ORF type:complete len:399 (-),score=24.02 TRINITY_DN52223_c0_g1_i1:149-1345(-)